MMALLIGPILYRVLDVHAADGPVALYTDPIFHHTLYLNDFFPRSFHNVWTMMAFAILGVFFLKGLCDYFGNYLVNYAGFSAVTNLRNTVFDKVLKQGAEFFESHSTGRLMSSIMNDIEKVQLATSHILADFLRQLFMAVFLTAVVLGKDPKLAVLSVIGLPLIILPVTYIGRRIRGTTRRTQDKQGELNQILQETLSGHMVVKAFGAEGYESGRFRDAARKLLKTNVQYVRQQALSSPLIEMVGAVAVVGLLLYAREQIKAATLTADAFASFRGGAGHAARTSQAPGGHPQYLSSRPWARLTRCSSISTTPRRSRRSPALRGSQNSSTPWFSTRSRSTIPARPRVSRSKGSIWW